MQPPKDYAECVKNIEEIQKRQKNIMSWEFWKETLFMAVIIFIPMMAILYALDLYRHGQCDTYGAINGKATKYESGVCFVQDEKGWVKPE